MSLLMRRFAGLVLVVGIVAGFSFLSRTNYVAEPASHAMIRMAWRTRGTRMRECRHRTAEELARLPVHMREEEVCEGRLLPYALVIHLDGQLADSQDVRPSGVREDRPLYVYREFPIVPGSHHLRVAFTRQGEPEEEAEHHEIPHEEAHEHQDPIPAPARLELDTVVTLESRGIALVTYDPDLERLVLRLKDRS